jgi:hypothetical protein
MKNIFKSLLISEIHRPEIYHFAFKDNGAEKQRLVEAYVSDNIMEWPIGKEVIYLYCVLFRKYPPVS